MLIDMQLSNNLYENIYLYVVVAKSTVEVDNDLEIRYKDPPIVHVVTP